MFLIDEGKQKKTNDLHSRTLKLSILSIFLQFGFFFKKNSHVDLWTTKFHLWTRVADTVKNGVEVTCLDAVDHGVKLPGVGQRGC